MIGWLCVTPAKTFQSMAREEARRIAAGLETPHLRPDGSPGTSYPLG